MQKVIFVVSIPADQIESADAMDQSTLNDVYPIVASGANELHALKNLIRAINDDAVDTENCFLKLSIVE